MYEFAWHCEFHSNAYQLRMRHQMHSNHNSWNVKCNAESYFFLPNSLRLREFMNENVLPCFDRFEEVGGSCLKLKFIRAKKTSELFPTNPNDTYHNVEQLWRFIDPNGCFTGTVAVWNNCGSVYEAASSEMSQHKFHCASAIWGKIIKCEHIAQKLQLF